MAEWHATPIFRCCSQLLFFVLGQRGLVFWMSSFSTAPMACRRKSSAMLLQLLPLLRSGLRGCRTSEAARGVERCRIQFQNLEDNSCITTSTLHSLRYLRARQTMCSMVDCCSCITAFSTRIDVPTTESYGQAACSFGTRSRGDEMLPATDAVRRESTALE